MKTIQEILALPSPRILVAPDKFKGTLSAGEVARCVADALRGACPGARITTMPLADGGEGTAAVLAGMTGLEPRVFAGHDALMRPCEVTYYASQGAVPEVCAVDASAFVGLSMMGLGCDPWRMTSWPVGEFVCAMSALGCGTIYVGVGGTATVDGGAGLLQAIGYRFYDSKGSLLPQPLLPDSFGLIARCEPPVQNMCRGRVVALVDVDVPLLPECRGGMSALSFAKQKGVAEADIPALGNALATYASAIHVAEPSVPGQGAGGGIGYALGAVGGADVRMGASELVSLAGVFSESYDLVVTGEGSFDRQSSAGKLTGTLIGFARRLGVPVLVVAGVADDDVCGGADVAVLTTKGCLPAGTGLTHTTAMSSLKSALKIFSEKIGRKI